MRRVGFTGTGAFLTDTSMGQAPADAAGYWRGLIPACALTVAGLTLMRGIFAAVNPLRVDEAYYWTWSRESVISPTSTIRR